jgi:hypothetical protein
MHAEGVRQLAQLARERRGIHAEGLLVCAATGGLAAAAPAQIPWLAVVPVAGFYALMTIGWVVRFLALLGRDCPSCGGPFFYSLDRLLYSLPYLGRDCAHCEQTLHPAP